MSSSTSFPVLSVTNAGTGYGIYSSATNIGGYFEGSNNGVLGYATGASGHGVYGSAGNYGAVTNYGGYFQANGASGRGVYGYATGTDGRGVYGYAGNTGAVTNYGGYFSASGASGRGVYGYASGASGLGVYGYASGVSGRGVYGSATNTYATNYGGYFSANGESGRGVYGSASGASGRGVHGYAGNTGAVTNYGGYFEAKGASGRGVYSYATGTDGIGVLGYATGSSGIGVYGKAFGGKAGFFYGDVSVFGNFFTLGTKSFVHPYPTDPSKEIVYVCLEGGESGVYVRGSGRLKEGRAEVELPEHFALVAGEEGLTVQVTPLDDCYGMFVAEKAPDRIVIKEMQGGTSDARFDYLVMGVRRGFENHQVIRENRHVKPDPDMSQQEYEEWMSLPKNKGMQKLLIENGTLTPEGKIDQDTATKLGWKLGPETKAEMMEKMSPRGPEVEENAGQ